MSYLRKPPALGDVATTIATAVDVTRDPYFSEVLCRVQQLQQINAGKAPQACMKTAPNLGGGVGLRKAMPALRAYVYAEQHPLAYVAGGAAVIGVPLLLGYLIGRR